MVRQTQLKVLLKQRHWQTHRTFNDEYDKAARKVDASLVGGGPSRAQLHRWISGEVKGLPYPNHCRVLEQMFPGWTAAQLLGEAIETSDPQLASVSQARPCRPTLRRMDDTWSSALDGHVVELALDLKVDIGRDGESTVTYRHELLNKAESPLTRLVREIWFEHVATPLVITGSARSDRRTMIQRIHDTANLSKFACQISPPIGPGESALIEYSIKGGRFVSDHFWRQSTRRHVRDFHLSITHQGAGDLVRCSATREHPDGAEVSADAGLIWDYIDQAALITLTDSHLFPNEAVTVRWEVSANADRADAGSST